MQNILPKIIMIICCYLLLSGCYTYCDYHTEFKLAPYINDLVIDGYHLNTDPNFSFPYDLDGDEPNWFYGTLNDDLNDYMSSGFANIWVNESTYTIHVDIVGASAPFQHIQVFHADSGLVDWPFDQTCD